MKLLSKIVFTILFLAFGASEVLAQNSKYKCMLQMTNYKGLEAYVVVSLIDAKGKYEKTLYMMGPDKKWYNGFKVWDKQLGKKKENLNGITGASVAAGDRNSVVLTIDEAKLNKGYKIRFESAVEEKEYYTTDVEIPLTTEALTQKAEGKGYIRFVKLSKVN